MVRKVPQSASSCKGTVEEVLREDAMNRLELIRKIEEVINENADHPAQELIDMGVALQAIGEALRDKTVVECQQIIQAVRALQ